jgi:hypothetical protein
MAKYQGQNSSYELKVDSSKKIFHAQAAGFFTIEDGTSFFNDYQKITKTFPAEEYTLIIDAPELKPSSPQVADMLGELLGAYMAVPFKARFLTTAGNVVAVSQFKRLGKEIPGWTESVQYVKDFNEALDKLS